MHRKYLSYHFDRGKYATKRLLRRALRDRKHKQNSWQRLGLDISKQYSLSQFWNVYAAKV